jgi:hypothetical protein
MRYYDYRPPFTGWGKIQRFGNMTITEKIDGTNAAVVCTEEGYVYAQSRKRYVERGNDNFGFGGWVSDHKEQLFEELGPGVHFGEWWGYGIQRGYGIEEHRFSMFNTARWTSVYNDIVTKEQYTPWDAIDSLVGEDGYTFEALHRCTECDICYVVPVLQQYALDTSLIRITHARLKRMGSVAAPEFMAPEGIVVYHQGQLLKMNDAKEEG